MASGAVKGVLIGCGILLLIAAVGVFLAVRYVSKNQDEWVARGTEVRDAGSAFGRSNTESACVGESLNRYRGDRSIMGAIRTRIWLSGCLETSTVEPEFCANVPPESEIMKTANWRVAQCAQKGLQGDSSCPNVVAEVQTYCASPERQKKTAP